MGQSIAKSAGMVLCGVALGLGIGWAVWSGAEDSPSPGMARDAGVEFAATPAGGAGSGGKEGGSVPGTSRSDSESGGGLDAAARREKLAARMLAAEEGGAMRGEHVRLMLELTTVPPDEIGPLLTRLARDGNHDQYYASYLLVRQAMIDPHAAMTFVTETGVSFGGYDGGSVTGELISELAKRDLPAAKAALAFLKDEELEAGVMAITKLLGEGAPEEALSFARERGNEEAETEALKGMAKSDPLAAAGRIEAGNERHEELVMEVAATLLAGDRAAFEGWADGLTDPFQRTLARWKDFEKDAKSDPRGAAMKAAEWMAGDPEAAGHAAFVPRELIDRWLKADKGAGEAAAMWAVNLPEEGGVRDSAVSRAGRGWVEQDSEAAAAWLRTLPGGPGRDEAVRALVYSLSYDAPEDAFTWAVSIQDASERKAALEKAVSEWGGKDPAAAVAALETLPPEDQAFARLALLKANVTAAAGR